MTRTPFKTSTLIEHNVDVQSPAFIPWKNTENNLFYETLPINLFQEFSEKAGLATGCDVKKIKPFWEHASSILEVGAGYGRVIDALLRAGYQHQLTALERCSVFYDTLLSKQYGNAVELIHGDLLLTDFRERSFDVILWLWSGVSDFIPNEQEIAFRKLARCLKPNGYLIVDTMACDAKPIHARPEGNQIYSTEVNNAIIYTYEPAPHEMERYAVQAGLAPIQKIICETDTKRKRWLYVMRFV